jgi:hypothetical protein
VRRLWNILSGNSLTPGGSLAPMIQATKALIKFCEDHDGIDKARQLRVVLAAVEANDRLAAVRAFKSIPFGGMGTFTDWFPPAKYENETAEYVQEIFVALTVQWYELASALLLPPKR